MGLHVYGIVLQCCRVYLFDYEWYTHSRRLTVYYKHLQEMKSTKAIGACGFQYLRNNLISFYLTYLTKKIIVV
jgi:hypothetical protein